MTAARRYSIDEYLTNMRRSAVAFNNPAVHGCHGWKLGEFLALGKAIVTLPISLALPAPLEHGTHVHVVDGAPASIDDALDRLRRDEPYRRRLETNARAWYDANLAPARVARRLLDAMRRPVPDARATWRPDWRSSARAPSPHRPAGEAPGPAAVR